MRAREFIVESNHKLALANLTGVLDTVRNSFADLGQEPRVRVDSLVNMVREKPGSEMFNVGTLKDLFDNDPAIKNMISNINKDDTGNRYVYLKPAIGQVSDIETDTEVGGNQTSGGDVEAGVGPEATVGKMVDRALNRRS